MLRTKSVKLENKLDKHTAPDTNSDPVYKFNTYDFLAGFQFIIDLPGDWG